MSKPSGIKIFGWVVALIVGAVVIAALFLTGSPSEEREKKFDSQRVGDLQDISYAIVTYYGRKGNLPDSLTELVQSGDDREYYLRSLDDPETGVRYTYSPKGPTEFSLCATFTQASLDSVRAPKVRSISGPNARLWEHSAGYHCFELNAIIRNAGTTCSATKPCLSGQACAMLPDATDAVCIAEGQECRAARCPTDKCTVSEGYPVQVTCEDAAPRKPTANSCILMRNAETNAVDCFGCAGTVCKDPAVGWEMYDAPSQPDYMGIPYTCFVGPSGCELAQ